MLRLRPYKISDGEALLKWFENQDEAGFRKWAASKFDYPLMKEQLDCYEKSYREEEKAWPMIALDQEGKPVGHFLMSRANYEKQSIHLGLIIVDPRRRGKGYGKKMLTLAIHYAFDILNMKRVTLGVFDNNPTAHQCYLSVGLKDEAYHPEVFPYKDVKWGLYEMAIEKEEIINKVI